MLLPGPEAYQLAIYIGWLLNGVAGGLVAGVFFILPSVFILFGLSWIYAAHGSLPVVAFALWGLKPVVVAIVLEAVPRIGKRALHGLPHVAIAAAAFLAVWLFGVPFPIVVLVAAGLGLLAGDRRKGAAEKRDVTPVREPTRPAPRPVYVLLWGIGLWVLPLVLLASTLGLGGLHSKVYLFFTGAAFVTFGGAYAVLAYVAQAAVATFGWLTALQAMDGLALAETTPGPLIMVLQFIGFMAGWNHSGHLGPLLSGTAAALLTTWATFLPGFLFIFLGAPYVEKLRHDRRWAAALEGITAAVVGVILNLAVVFGSAVLVPKGEPDFLALGLTAVALLVLLRWHVAVQWVVLGGLACGLLRFLVLG
jgi:chromate transporter